MEELGISHLDIKPLNIVWNKAKLIDFEISLMSFGKDTRVFKTVNNKKVRYTKEYAAPEIHSGNYGRLDKRRITTTNTTEA